MRFMLQSSCVSVCVCVLAVEDVGLVEAVHLFQEDEGEDGVGTEASVVRSETFPQREETFRAHDSHQHLLMDGDRKHNLIIYISYITYPYIYSTEEDSRSTEGCC